MAIDQVTNMLSVAAALSMAGWVAQTPELRQNMNSYDLNHYGNLNFHDNGNLGFHDNGNLNFHDNGNLGFHDNSNLGFHDNNQFHHLGNVDRFENQQHLWGDENQNLNPSYMPDTTLLHDDNLVHDATTLQSYVEGYDDIPESKFIQNFIPLDELQELASLEEAYKRGDLPFNKGDDRLQTYPLLESTDYNKLYPNLQDDPNRSQQLWNDPSGTSNYFPDQEVFPDDDGYGSGGLVSPAPSDISLLSFNLDDVTSSMSPFNHLLDSISDQHEIDKTNDVFTFDHTDDVTKGVANIVSKEFTNDVSKSEGFSQSSQGATGYTPSPSDLKQLLDENFYDLYDSESSSNVNPFEYASSHITPRFDKYLNNFLSPDQEKGNGIVDTSDDQFEMDFSGLSSLPDNEVLSDILSELQLPYNNEDGTLPADIVGATVNDDWSLQQGNSESPPLHKTTTSSAPNDFDDVETFESETITTTEEENEEHLLSLQPHVDVLTQMYVQTPEQHQRGDHKNYFLPETGAVTSSSTRPRDDLSTSTSSGLSSPNKVLKTGGGTRKHVSSRSSDRLSPADSTSSTSSGLYSPGKKTGATKTRNRSSTPSSSEGLSLPCKTSTEVGDSVSFTPSSSNSLFSPDPSTPSASNSLFSPDPSTPSASNSLPSPGSSTPSSSNVRFSPGKHVLPDVPYTPDELVSMDIDEFQHTIAHVDETKQLLLKDLRKKGKNKFAARNSRKRKHEVIEGLDTSLELIRMQQELLVQEQQSLVEETRQFREKTSLLSEYILQQLVDEEGNSYLNTHKLEYTTDGNVYVVPLALNEEVVEGPLVQNG